MKREEDWPPTKTEYLARHYSLSSKVGGTDTSLIYNPPKKMGLECEIKGQLEECPMVTRNQIKKENEK